MKKVVEKRIDEVLVTIENQDDNDDKEFKDKEFFACSEEALTALLDLKHELFQAYPR